jgi:ribosomal protein L13
VTDLVSYAAIGVSIVAVVIALFGYIEERKKRVLLEKMVKQMMRVARSQERQVKALQVFGAPKSSDEIELEKQKLAWDKMKTVGRALGLDVDE